MHVQWNEQKGLANTRVRLYLKCGRELQHDWFPFFTLSDWVAILWSTQSFFPPPPHPFCKRNWMFLSHLVSEINGLKVGLKFQKSVIWQFLIILYWFSPVVSILLALFFIVPLVHFSPLAGPLLPKIWSRSHPPGAKTTWQSHTYVNGRSPAHVEHHITLYVSVFIPINTLSHTCMSSII